MLKKPCPSVAVWEYNHGRHIFSRGVFEMEPYRLHLFVCLGKRCAALGAEDLLDDIKGRIKAQGVTGVKVSRSGCVKLCKETECEGEYSPVMVVYPEGVWYRNVTPADLAEIVESHVKGGRAVERLVHFRLGPGAAG